MSLSIEYRRRVERWISELEKHFFVPVESVSLSGFESPDFWRIHEARQHERRAYRCGEKWGNPWTYGYFFGEITLPSSCAGKTLVFRPDTGRESLIYLNGKAMGAKDFFHFNIPVSGIGEAGERVEVFIESYAGHGTRNGHVGPAPEGTVTVPIPAGKQAVMGESWLGIWNEEIYLLWIDVSALYDLRTKNPPESLRVAEIDSYLKRFTTLVDFESGTEQMLQTVSECRTMLRKVLDCRNGSTAPTMYMIGHSHLDVAWKWPINETRRKCGRTFANQLALLEQYGEYRYLNSQPYLYELLQENYPDIYERVKARVAEGRIIPEGGMYVESDTNLPSGESLIRQFLYGKRFFREAFGVENRMCWLPDAFGYSASFPQIMAGCGIDAFSTSKILWSYNGGEPFPYITFYWQGLDGTKVLAHNHNEYNAHSRPSFVIDAWETMQQKDGLRSRIMPFGYGDGGGGALRDHLEFLRIGKDLEGMPRTRIASPVEYFDDLKEDIASGYTTLPSYVGELYLQVHRGVYTTQAKTKKGNRQSEVALREVEFWLSVAILRDGPVSTDDLVGAGVPGDVREKLDELWKLLLVNQFHDILPGSSIHRVHEEAERDYKRLLRESDQLLAQTMNRFPHARGYTLFNSVGVRRAELVRIPPAIASSYACSLQKMGEDHYALVTVPACGHISLRTALDRMVESLPKDSDGPICRATSTTIENDRIVVRYTSEGELTDITDRKTGETICRGPLNRLRMYRDVPSMFDAWDIDSMYTQTEVPLSAPATIEVLSEGPHFVALRITRMLHHSHMEQEIRLKRGSRRIDFVTRMDWQETHKLLKVEFDTGIQTTEALHNVQYGYVARPNHQTRQYDQDRFEVCAQRWTAMADNSRGGAVLNDCKYGVSSRDSVIALSLLRSPLAPDMTADKGLQEFTYAYYFWSGALSCSGLDQESYRLNIPIRMHKGASLPERSYVVCDTPGIVIDTLKPAEDGNGLILRIYDMLNVRGDASLQFDFDVKAAYETDMLEKNGVAIPVSSNRIQIAIGNFQVRTIRLII
jgi:alpha-mannosidase